MRVLLELKINFKKSPTFPSGKNYILYFIGIQLKLVSPLILSFFIESVMNQQGRLVMCVCIFPPNENNDFLFRECNLTVRGYSFGPTLGRPMMSPGSSQQEFIKHQVQSPHYATNTQRRQKHVPAFQTIS